MLKLFVASIAWMVLVLSTGVPSAKPLTWRLQDTNIPTGGSLEGFFEFDPDSEVFGDWSFTVSGGLSFFPDYTWDPSNSPAPRMLDFGHPVESFVIGHADTDSRQLRITPFAALTNEGGEVGFGQPGSFDCFNCLPGRHVAGLLVAEPIVAAEEPSWSAVKSLFEE